MAESLQVDIVTPVQSAFSGAASEVLLPAWEGQMGIYPDHDAVLALLRAGRCHVVTSSGTREYVVGRGFAEVGPDRVTILTEHCEARDAVDENAAREELERLEQELSAMENVYSEEYRQAQIAHEHAKARLGLI